MTATHPARAVTSPAAAGTGLPELDGHRERLVERFCRHHGLDRETVESRLDAICARLTDARVRAYLPLLVERALRVEVAAGRADHRRLEAA